MMYPTHHQAAEDKDDFCLNFDAFAGGYHRQANTAFSSCHGSGDSNETSFARLLFGKEKFTLAESFPGGRAGQDELRATKNPFLNATTLNPNYDFEENGAMFRATVNTTWGCWRMGLRGSIPFRSLDVKEVCSGDHRGVNFEGATSKDDLYQTRKEENTFTVAGGAGGTEQTTETNDVFAARFDLLSAMDRIQFTTTGNQQSLVRYQQNTPTIRIAGVSVGTSMGNNQPPVAVIQRNDGSVPANQRWGDTQDKITGQVAGDGSGLSNNQRGQFRRGTNYTSLGNNTSAQDELWVVPTIAQNGNNASNGEGSITTDARQIWAAITQALPTVDDSIEDFISRNDIDFCDGRTQGAGDLDFELYLGYDWTDCADIWSELSFGVRVPTGQELCDCTNVLQVPAGLNDHVGIRIGSEHGWDAFDWLKMNLGLRYTFVIEDNEQVAAPFQGATITGIGPCVQAQTKWGYLEGFFNATMPVSDCCGFDLGYHVYHQPGLDCDDISICSSTAIDLAGQSGQQLDSSILTRDTQRTSHKVRAAFHFCSNNCHFNMGFDHAFAGKNIMRDTTWYVGVTADY